MIKKTKHSLGSIENPYDISIVGGGIAGLYAMYKLQKHEKFKDKSIVVYEASERLGGRIETKAFPPFKAEFGPMRFEFPGQARLQDLALKLGLKITKDKNKIEKDDDIIPFEPYESEESVFPLHDIIDSCERRSKNVIELFFLGIVRVFKCDGNSTRQWYPDGAYNNAFDPLNKLWLHMLDDEDFDNIRRYAKCESQDQSQHLYKLGIWNALHSVLSHAAVTRIRDIGNFYHFTSENPNAAEWLIFWLRALRSVESLQLKKEEEFDNAKTLLLSKFHERQQKEKFGKLSSLTYKELVDRYDYLYKFKDGSDTIVTRICSEIDTNLISKNHRLIAVNNCSDSGLTKLTFQNEKVIYCRNTILAVPQIPLKKIIPFSDFDGLTKSYINSVMPITLLKCFFLVSNPWWDKNTKTQSRASLMPTREVHYYSDDENKNGLILMYTDRPACEYWTTFVQDDVFKDGVQYFHDEAEIYDENGKRIDFSSHKHIPNPDDTLDLKNQFFKNLIEPEDELRIFEKIMETITDKELKSKPYNLTKEIIDSLRSAASGNKAVLRNRNILKVIHGLTQRIVKYGIRDWGREPYGAACYSWEPGAKSLEILNHLKSFKLEKSNTENIHICGESFCDYNGFIEGCLRSVDSVIEWLEKHV